MNIKRTLYATDVEPSVFIEDLDVATTLVFGKSVHNFRCQLIDTLVNQKTMFFTVAMEGEYTYPSPNGGERIVKHPVFTIKQLSEFEQHVSKQFERRGYDLVFMSVVYLDDSRRFGFTFSVKLQET